VLHHHPADKAFRSTITFLQNRDSPETTLQAQRFSSARSLGITSPVRLAMGLPRLRGQVSRFHGWECTGVDQLLPPAVVGRLRHFLDTSDLNDGVGLAINCSADLSLRLICSAVYLVRLVMKFPAQPGRVRTLIQPGPALWTHVSVIEGDVSPFVR